VLAFLLLHCDYSVICHDNDKLIGILVRYFSVRWDTNFSNWRYLSLFGFWLRWKLQKMKYLKCYQRMFKCVQFWRVCAIFIYIFKINKISVDFIWLVSITIFLICLVYIDAGTLSTDTATLNFAFSGDFSRYWDVKVTQIPCGTNYM